MSVRYLHIKTRDWCRANGVLVTRSDGKFTYVCPACYGDDGCQWTTLQLHKAKSHIAKYHGGQPVQPPVLLQLRGCAQEQVCNDYDHQVDEGAEFDAVSGVAGLRPGSMLQRQYGDVCPYALACSLHHGVQRACERSSGANVLTFHVRHAHA